MVHHIIILKTTDSEVIVLSEKISATRRLIPVHDGDQPMFWFMTIDYGMGTTILRRSGRPTPIYIMITFTTKLDNRSKWHYEYSHLNNTLHLNKVVQRMCDNSTR